MNFANALQRLVLEFPASMAMVRKDPATNQEIRTTHNCVRGFFLNALSSGEAPRVETFPSDFSVNDYMADDFEIED